MDFPSLVQLKATKSDNKKTIDLLKWAEKHMSLDP